MIRLSIYLLLLNIVFVQQAPAKNASSDSKSSYRHPVAIALDSKQEKLLTANSKTGTISVVDLKSRTVVENRLEGSLRDLIRISDSRYLTVDFDHHELIEFEIDKLDKLRVLNRVPVEKYPQRVIATTNADRVYVSSLWSRRITCLKRTVDDRSGKAAFSKLATIDTEFAPREMLWIPSDNRLVVAGNFGGILAVINCQNHQLESSHKTTGHNIRGLGLTNDQKTILVSHQMLNELAHTSRNDIHWGLLMSNDLRWIRKAAFYEKGAELYQSSHMHPLGKEGHAAGDPGRLAFARNGTVVVTLSGTNEIAFGTEDEFVLKRTKVGNRPVDVSIDDQSNYAYIANSFDDSISVLDLTKSKIVDTISLGKTGKLTDLERGERLFFDASLSHDGWMSCHSCHTDGHTNGGLNDNFTDGSFGAPKRVLSLLGRKNTEPLAWLGDVPNFETQIRNSIRSTMKSKDPPEEKQVKLLARYVESLSAPPSVAKARGNLDQQAIEQGKNVFTQMGCAKCHQPPSFTSPRTYDVGLKDEMEHSRFNPPSLLGASQRLRFFHDGRARSLNEVIYKFKHKIPPKSDAESIKALLIYLESL